MVNYPNQNKIVYGIVVGGNDGDPDPTQSGGVRVYLPNEYGKNVKVSDLPFSRVLAQGTQEGITHFNPPPEHGSAVMCMKMDGMSGTGHLIVLGTVPNDISEDATIPGNSIGLWPAIDKAIKDIANIRIPPNIGSGSADTRPPKEKGEKWKHELAKYIPSTVTLWPMNGLPIPQVQNVATAVQAFGNVLTADMLNMLPGMNMTLGSLLSNMPSELLNQLTKNMPPEMSRALNSMNYLMQSIEITETGGFNTATKINPDVFFINAVNLLVDARNITDLVEIYQRLQYDTSLFGLESLPPVDYVMKGGPFGDIPMQIDALGNITSQLPEPVQKLIEAFASLMTNKSGGFPGVFPNQNMFGDSAQVLNEMFNRLPTEELNKAVSQMQKHVAPGTNPRDNQNKAVDAAMKAVTHGLGLLRSFG